MRRDPAASRGDSNRVRRLVVVPQFCLAYTYSDRRLSTVEESEPGLLGLTSTQTDTYVYADASHPHATTQIAADGLTGGATGVLDGLPDPGNLSYDQAGRVASWDPYQIGSQTVRGATNTSYDPMGNPIVADDVSVLSPTDTDSAYDAEGDRVARETGGDLSSSAGVSTTQVY